MNSHRSRPVIRAIALVAVLSSGGHLAAQDAAGTGSYTPPAVPAQEQPEVLSRGPVHEAFAEPVNMQLQTGLVAPQQPPPNIEEIPPAERPQGSQYIWIPGYWSWDADRTGYIWVSACWRAAPPKMSWVPGYWAQTPGGWEWVAGYWAPAGVQNIEYLPAPPAIEDLEPAGIQTSPDTIWVPPCMYWIHGQYVRRAGYWLAAKPDWVWVPAHYVMTPRGYIFAEGHWDYSLDRRGVLFAPVYFPGSVYRRTAFTFSPNVVIDVGLLRVSLFAYPRYSHYYFGDYYDDAYLRIGIFPWFESRRRHIWYDPVYEHDRWRHQRSEPRWEARERDDYNRRRADINLRPAHTFREQESRLSRLPEPQRRAFQVAQPIGIAVTRQKASMKFEQIDTGARQKISKQAVDVRTFREERAHWEAPATGIDRTGHPGGEHKPAVMPATERRQVIQPTGEHKPSVIPAPEHRQTVQPIKERKPSVTPPSEYRRTIQPVEEHRETVMPTTQLKQPFRPAGTGGSTVSSPNSHRETTFTPPRETQTRQAERIQIPASPVTGNSGKQGFFQKGPPGQPADEKGDYRGKDNRRK